MVVRTAQIRQYNYSKTATVIYLKLTLNGNHHLDYQEKEYKVVKAHMLKAEVSPKTKILLIEMAKKDKRSLKKQVEYIIESEVRKQNSKPKHDIMEDD